MLHAISKAVKDNNADIGFGFDGDGDRCGVIDNEGNEIFSDKIGLIIARNLSPDFFNKISPSFYFVFVNGFIFTYRIFSHSRPHISERH